jgi:hypothetical protein
MRRVALLILLSAIAAGGCRPSGPRMTVGRSVSTGSADNLGRSAATLASSQLSCPTASLRVTSLGASTYEVVGCSRRATYVCDTRVAGVAFGVHREAVCVYQGSPPGAPRPEAAASASWSDDAIREGLAPLRHDIVACLGEDHRPARVRVLFSAGGSARVTAWHSPTLLEERRCIHGVIARVALPGRVAAMREMRLQLGSPEDSTSSSSQSATSTTPAGESDYAATVRGALDADSQAILACTGGEPVAVSVEWRAGAITTSLRGTQHGTDVEGCIASLVRPPTPPEGSSGSVLHVVR